MHYVIGDVHGHYTCLMDFLEKLNLQKDDVVYFVGDVCDRAPTAKEQADLLRWCFQNISPDGQFRMVMGNHELEHLADLQERFSRPLTKPADEIKLNDRYGFFPQCYEQDLTNMEIYRFLQTLPIFHKLTMDGHDYFITHSWITGENNREFGGYDEEVNIFDSVWDRHYSVYGTVEEGNFTVIHGHTPTMCDYYYDCNPEIEPLVIKRKGNINLDCGLFWRQRQDGDLAAYCIETDEVYYLYGEKNKIIDLSSQEKENSKNSAITK